MGTPKLRVDPVFPRHTGAERQKQGLNLELRDEFPGEGRSPDWGRDAVMTVCPHIAPGCSQAHVDVDLSQRSGRDPRPPSPSSALIRFCHCKVGHSPDGRAAARRAHLGRVTGGLGPCRSGGQVEQCRVHRPRRNSLEAPPKWGLPRGLRERK